ncbi:signal recognition particle protein [Verrucomicrobiota bacterium]
MFESLSSALQKTFKNLRGHGRLSEQNVKDALREVRMALLEADVNFKVAKQFVANVREKCMGEEVLESVTPGQQIIARVKEEMENLLGGAHKDFNLNAKPASVMMIGLHGSGKTTTTGKLAKRWVKDGKKVLLVACDIRRPAAVDQLRTLAEQVGADIVVPEPGETVPAVGARGRQQAERVLYDRVIYDTGGRFQIDDELVAELKELHASVAPMNTVLVLDAAIGQESVNIAEAFHDALGGLTGLVLTKLDGDARGGAALSVHSATGCPILMTGAGEGMDDLHPFYPDRMASRILGMGDVVSLVEKAQDAFDEDEALKMQEAMSKKSLNLQDFHDQMQMMKKLGPMEKLIELMPGAANMPDHVKAQMGGAGAQIKKQEAVIRSMTMAERKNPKLINFSRRKRIAAGSGTSVAEVNQLLKSFEQAKKMSKRMKKMQKRLPRMSGWAMK